MALSLLNYFFLDIPNARIPFMILDACVVFGLDFWQKRMKKAKELAQHDVEVKHETTKKASRAQKAASRQQRKAEEKKHTNDSGPASFVPKQHIQQPDKNKKSR